MARSRTMVSGLSSKRFVPAAWLAATLFPRANPRFSDDLMSLTCGNSCSIACPRNRRFESLSTTMTSKLPVLGLLELMSVCTRWSCHECCNLRSGWKQRETYTVMFHVGFGVGSETNSGLVTDADDAGLQALRKPMRHPVRSRIFAKNVPKLLLDELFVLSFQFGYPLL